MTRGFERDEVGEFLRKTTSPGEHILAQVKNLLADSFASFENRSDLTFERNNWGQMVISPKQPESRVTWLNHQLCSDVTWRGAFYQEECATIYDPCKEKSYGNGKQSKGKRKRH